MYTRCRTEIISMNSERGWIKTSWHETLSLLRGNPQITGGFPSQKSGNIEFLCCMPEQDEQNFEFLCMIWDVMRSMDSPHKGLVITMTTIASQITSPMVVYSTVYSDAGQRKHQRSASLAFVWGIHRDRWIPRTNGQLCGKCFHLMTSSWIPVRFGVSLFLDKPHILLYKQSNQRISQMRALPAACRELAVDYITFPNVLYVF